MPRRTPPRWWSIVEATIRSSTWKTSGIIQVNYATCDTRPIIDDINYLEWQDQLRKRSKAQHLMAGAFVYNELNYAYRGGRRARSRWTALETCSHKWLDRLRESFGT